MVQAAKPLYLYFLLAIVAVTSLWSWIDCYKVSVWWMEAAPAFIAIILLALTYQRFPFTPLSYTLVAIHSVILLIGAHYTYALVPWFTDLKEAYDLSRNHYDKVGHFAQGFIPAIILRELLIRTSSLKRGKWMFAIIVFSCLGISAIYELIEWFAAEMDSESAEDFLGTQGDVWDTQKDMFFAMIGAIIALITLSRWHDKQLDYSPCARE